MERLKGSQIGFFRILNPDEDPTKFHLRTIVDVTCKSFINLRFSVANGFSNEEFATWIQNNDVQFNERGLQISYA